MLVNYHSEGCYNHRQKIKIKKHAAKVDKTRNVYKKLARRLKNNSPDVSVIKRETSGKPEHLYSTVNVLFSKHVSSTKTVLGLSN